MELLRIIGIYPETISDGYGLRYIKKIFIEYRIQN